MRFFTIDFLRFIRTVFKKKSRLEIYADGSSKHGFGSWAYIVSQHGKCISERAGRVRCSICNTMEFQAAIEALKSIPANSITLFTDSKILVDAMTFGNGHYSFQTLIKPFRCRRGIHLSTILSEASTRSALMFPIIALKGISFASKRKYAQPRSPLYIQLYSNARRANEFQ